MKSAKQLKEYRRILADQSKRLGEQDAFAQRLKQANANLAQIANAAIADLRKAVAACRAPAAGTDTAELVRIEGLLGPTTPAAPTVGLEAAPTTDQEAAHGQEAIA